VSSPEVLVYYRVPA
jgi:isocitrate/isopropylmalate dehydrogenase